MLTLLGVESKIFSDGLADIKAESHQKNSLKNQLVEPYKNFRFHNLVSQLKQFDAVIVVGHMPSAFMRHFMRDSLLRQQLPDIPIVLYDLVYLPTRGSWMKYLREGSPQHGIPDGGHFGLERYDYYLCVSVVSEYPLPPEPNPYALIGVNLDDGSLYSDQNEDFVALLDFERSNHLEERRIQIEVLKETNTKYVQLSGSYPIEKIRAIYRKSSIYFLAHRESFGLPICELQACGSYIFTPYSEWCPSHWIKDDLSQPGAGQLSPNFVVYHNDKQKLIQEITRIKASFVPGEARKTFETYHPQLLRGNIAELKKFIDLLQAGKIHGKSHQNYPALSNFP